MTALSTAEHRLEGFEIGAEEFLPKPFHLRELLLRVRHVLENHPVVHQVTCHGRTVDLDNRAIVQAVQALNASGKLGDSGELVFSLDPKTRRPVIQVVDRITGEVLQQIPNRRILRMAQDLKIPSR